MHFNQLKINQNTSNSNLTENVYVRDITKGQSVRNNMKASYIISALHRISAS